MSRFLDALHSGRVLLMDGAMGTELQRAGLAEGECGELWNLAHPERVAAIHQAYIDAGADCLLTNTFQAIAASLARWGKEKKLAAICRAGLQLARDVAGPERFVLLDVGPVKPELQLETAQIAISIARQEKADAILLETCSDRDNLLAFLARREANRIEAERLPVLVSYTFRHAKDGVIRTERGPRPRASAFVTKVYDTVAALGVNCGRDIGMDSILEILRQYYRQVTDLPLFARPNAGTPIRKGNRWVYPLTPEEMARRLPELLEMGVRMVGGCCGTTPAHIAALRPVVEGWNARR